MGFGVEDGELKGRAGDGIDAPAIPGHLSNGGDVFKLENEIGSIWGVDEFVATPGLQRRVDIVESFGCVDWEVGVGAGVGEEDGLRLLDLGRHWGRQGS